MRRQDVIESITGGRFVPASELLLPPRREFQIQGGRFIPAVDMILPPTRTTFIGVDFDQAYHFGSIAASVRQANRKDE